ncbi:bifunctional nicotinamidase/pyrazinamidase, partial [Treponema sp. OttesenSCG-928-L16]|nr:bifunctional nicotinamidase/pyrazinamidase [Treponema sp. OttesenSCG-928-L16]
GALAVKDGDRVIRPLNALASFFAGKGGKVIATQDWHPPRHISFASAHPKGAASAEDVLWPDHCVQASAGAELHALLDQGPVHFIVRKGFRPDLDSYSAFFENDRRTETGLHGLLKGMGIDTVYIGGLAVDYCVLYSVLDALRLGYKTILIADAVKGVGVPEGSIEQALEMMRQAGALFMDSGDIL